MPLGWTESHPALLGGGLSRRRASRRAARLGRLRNPPPYAREARVSRASPRSMPRTAT